MINLPCNATSMSQVTPCQNVPVQTSQYNFPTCQQRQTSTQQMQTAACGPCSGVSQGPFVCQPDTYIVTHQCTPGTSQPVTNPCHPVFQSACNPSSVHPSCGQLSQNVLDQIRACISNAAPIFILPSGCQQPSQQQQPPSAPVSPQAMAPSSPPAYPPIGLTYPAACYPPPFYPYPMPVPFCDPFTRRETARVDDCGCCRKRDVDPAEMRSIARAGCRFDELTLDEHRCMPTTDDTVCSKRNCPSSLHLQALASQFLSMQGVIPCAATRLVLRKVPGSNVTTTMEDTMAKAQKAINVLTKDQLLAESRYAQQVNALINLHMTANPPPNIIPILTLVQLKMNLLKAQVEGLVNQKLMEIQGVGVEVETDLIDPTVLALKSDAELRDFLSVLRQKECDERVNVNFAPYRSQRAIAETRLNNVQNKIRQVETEFDRRRCAMLPAPTLSSRIVQQFSVTPCYSARFEDPRRLYSTVPDVPRSPDPFSCVKPRSPKRLLLKPRAGNPETPARVASPASAPSNPPKATVDDGGRAKEISATVQSPKRQRSNCACCCERTTSEESVDEAKKKLQRTIAEIDAGMMSNVDGPRFETLPLMKLTSSVCVRIAMEKCETDVRKCEEWDKKSVHGTPCDSKCCMATAYVNVTDEIESMESQSDTITLSGRIDGDVCESRDVVEIRNIDRALDRDEFASSPNVRQSEEEEMKVISKTDESSKIRDIEIKDSRGVSLLEVKQEEATARTAAKVADNGAISSAQEAQRKLVNGIYSSSSLEITLRKDEECESEQKERKDETLPLIAGETIERNNNETKTISKSKKKTRFQIISLMTNIVYDKKPEYQDKISNKTMKNAEDITSGLDIEKLNKSSMTSFLQNTIAQDITEKDHPGDMLLERLDLPKLCVDHQCQTILKLAKEDVKPVTMLSKTNIFPPFKHLRKHIIDNEKQGSDIEIRSASGTKTGITTPKCSSHCNDVIIEDISETLRKNNTSDHQNLEHKESFISEIFSVISNVVTFINKIITSNARLLYFSDNAMSRKSLNIHMLRKDNLKRDDFQVISKDPLAGTSYILGSKQTTFESNHTCRDTNVLSRRRISIGEGCDRIHKIRHSIIEDKENDARYLLIGTSSHNHDLTRNFGRPHNVQRNLLIRSRLKSPANLPDHPCPFSLVKKRKKEIEDDETKRKKTIKMIAKKKVFVSKDSEKLWMLSKVIKAEENNGNMSETKKYSNEFKNQISHDDIANNNALQDCKVIDNHSTVKNELATNVHDYIGLQTQINTSVYKFSKLQIYKKIHRAHSY